MTDEKIKELAFEAFDNAAKKFPDEAADNLFGSKRRKARKARFNMLSQFNKLDEQGNAAIPAITSTLTQAMPQIQAYAAQQYPNATIPTQPMQAATTLAGLHEGAVFQSQQQNPDFTYAQAEEEVMGNQLNNDATGEVEEFLGGILGTVLNAGKKFLTKVNEKRMKKGKKPLFAGKAWKNLKEKVNANESTFIKLGEAGNEMIAALKKDNAGQTDSELLAGLKAAANGVAETQKKDFLKTNLPYIITGVLLLILVGFLIRSKS